MLITYMKPTEKTAVRPSLRFKSIFKPKTVMIGRRRIKKSEIVLVICGILTTAAGALSAHLPGAPEVGFPLSQ